VENSVWYSLGWRLRTEAISTKNASKTRSATAYGRIVISESLGKLIDLVEDALVLLAVKVKTSPRRSAAPRRLS